MRTGRSVTAIPLIAEVDMHRFSFLGVALPVIALAACTDSGKSGVVVAPPDFTLATSRGAVLARELCGQCHGVDLNGGTVGSATCPALSVAGIYTLAEFNELLVLGVARDGKVVDPLMSAGWSLSSADRFALHEYLSRYRDQ